MVLLLTTGDVADCIMMLELFVDIFAYRLLGRAAVQVVFAGSRVVVAWYE